MIEPAAHGRRAADGHLHRSGRAHPSGVAELPVVVAPPAQHRGVGHQRAGVIAAGRDGRRMTDAADRVRNEGVGGGPVTELPGLIRAPAVRSSIGCHGAGMKAAAGQRRHGWRSVLEGRRRSPVNRRPITELACRVPAPAPDRAVDEHGAGVVVPGGYHGGRRQAGDRDWLRAICRGAVAQLSVCVRSPAGHAALCPQRANVIEARRDREGVGDV